MHIKFLYFFLCALLVFLGINTAQASYTPGFDEGFANDVTHAKTVDPIPARKYKVDSQLFYSSNLTTDPFHTLKPITNLINRYNIHKKSVLSIAAGDGATEEIWFVKVGHNTLSIFDIDENNLIENRIKSGSYLPRVDTKDVVTFYIGDFLNPANSDLGQFDVVYISTLTPIEVRMSKISHQFVAMKNSHSQDYDFLEKIYGNSDPNWPSWEKPFPHYFSNIVGAIKSGGIFIYQKYYEGPDTLSNPNYLKQIQRQFLDNGLVPIEFYTFKEGGAYLLMVGYKGTLEEARAYYKSVQKNEKLTSFHGRGQGIDNSARLIYSFE